MSKASTPGEPREAKNRSARLALALGALGAVHGAAYVGFLVLMCKTKLGGVGPLYSDKPSVLLSLLTAPFALSTLCLPVDALLGSFPFALSTLCLPVDALLGSLAVVLGAIGINRARSTNVGRGAARTGCLLGVAALAAAVIDFAVMASGWGQ